MFHVLMFDLVMPERLGLILVIVAAAGVYLLGNDRVALWDRDEPRNAQAARQMYQSGDWVVPRFLDKVRTAKPVFTYWCQASAMHVFGDNTFAARLPSAVAMTLTLILLRGVIGRAVDPQRAFWTVFVLATSGMVIGWCARNSLTDAVLLLWITLAQFCWFAILRGDARWRVVLIMAVAIGLAGLTKGPVVLGVMGTTLAVWLALNWKWYLRGRRLPRGFEVATPQGNPTAAHELNEQNEPHGRGAHAMVNAVVKALAAIAIVVVIVGPWMYLVEKRAPGFIGTTVSRDVIQRTLEPLEQHKGPPGIYALVVWGMFFPWSLLLPLAAVTAWRHWRGDARIRFAIAAVIGPWLLFECVQTKLPHYLLPIFPPLAYLTADGIVRCLRREQADLLTRGTKIAVAIWAVIVALLGVAPWLAASRFDDLPIAAMIALSAAGIVYAAVVLACFLRERIGGGLIAMGAGMMLLIAIVVGAYLPRANFLRLNVAVADVLKANGAGADQTQAGDVQMIGYKEPGLAFYQGGTIREQGEGDFLVKHPPEQWPRFVVIREDWWNRMPPDVKSKLEVLGTCRGLAYADQGRTWTIWIVRKR